MTKVLVLYYSSYGHIETMAGAVAEGARGVSGAQVVVKRVPELVPDDVAKASGIKLDQDAEVATPDELADYDAIIFGTPTRFGKHGGADAQLPRPKTGGALVPEKSWSARSGPCSSPPQPARRSGNHHQPSFHTTLLHHGMVIVGLPYTFEGNSEDERDQRRHPPYGAIDAGRGRRQPDAE